MQQDHTLYITITPNGVKLGTCEHCVVHEKGRPERAWNPQGDSELDFPRDQYVALMQSLGVTVKITQEFVCP